MSLQLCASCDAHKCKIIYGAQVPVCGITLCALQWYALFHCFVWHESQMQYCTQAVVLQPCKDACIH